MCQADNMSGSVLLSVVPRSQGDPGTLVAVVPGGIIIQSQ
jgi:hypothetical protein